MNQLPTFSTAPIAVLGAGSWGTAVAILLARNGWPIRLWGRNPTQIEEMLTTRRNRAYLGDIEFPPGLLPCSDLDKLLGEIPNLVIAIPSANLATFIYHLRGRLLANARLVLLTKGLAPDTAETLDHLVREILPEETYGLAAVSGPTFAREVAIGLPAAVTVAAATLSEAKEIARWFHGPQVRAYTSNDLLGVELGGALKNVLAIAVGISDGMGMGANARTALISRGLAELSRLYRKAGAKEETLMGLSGLGDLVLTCTDDQSRNRRLGLALGRGASLAQALSDIGQAVEGVTTALSVIRLTQRYQVELPICEVVNRVLYEHLPVQEAARLLLARQSRSELDSPPAD